VQPLNFYKPHSTDQEFYQAKLSCRMVAVRSPTSAWAWDTFIDCMRANGWMPVSRRQVGPS
jgi:hypothetical protein